MADFLHRDVATNFCASPCIDFRTKERAYMAKNEVGLI